MAPAQREVLLLIPGMPPAVKQKLAKDQSPFTVAEAASMTLALAEDLPEGDARKQVAVLYLAKHLMDQLQSGIVGMAQSPTSRKSTWQSTVAEGVLLQFKITLLGASPPIWRRIQVQDGTLDALHEYIQTAMGWTNSHLHRFEIDGRATAIPLCSRKISPNSTTSIQPVRW